MKGYYDLLLTGSLGKLDDRQRDILLESKETAIADPACFHVPELLGAGKRQIDSAAQGNDLRDCIKDLTCRWQDAFQRAQGPPRHFRFIPSWDLSSSITKKCSSAWQISGQRSEAYSSARLRNFDCGTALLGTAHF